jgi:hypothetical protein
MTTTAERIEQIQKQYSITQDEHEVIYNLADLATDTQGDFFEAYARIAKLVGTARDQAAPEPVNEALTYLDQNEIFRSSTDGQVKIADMHPNHARNAAHVLLTRSDIWALDAGVETASALLWMTTRPLFLALRTRAGH